MPKTMSSNDAKQRWGSVLSYVTDQADEVIVESHGKPRAVVISVAAYEELEILREQRRRVEALDRLRQLEERIAARNTDLSEEEAIEFSVRLGREINAAAAARAGFGASSERR